MLRITFKVPLLIAMMQLIFTPLRLRQVASHRIDDDASNGPALGAANQPLLFAHHEETSTVLWYRPPLPDDGDEGVEPEFDRSGFEHL